MRHDHGPGRTPARSAPLRGRRMSPIQTEDGFLVLITRGEGRSMRTTHRKRRGSRCSIRRYEFLYPSIEKEPARHVPIAYGFADGANVSQHTPIGRRQATFYAFVTYPVANRAKHHHLLRPETHRSENKSCNNV